VRADDGLDRLAGRGVDRLDPGGAGEHDREEEGVPGAPAPEPPTVDVELVRGELLLGEPPEADDVALFVAVDAGPLAKRARDLFGRERDGLGEAGVGDRRPVGEQAVERDRDPLLVRVEDGDGGAELVGELGQLGVGEVLDWHGFSFPDV
jgi:hypothetical protein